jgi:hypothetical protein
VLQAALFPRLLFSEISRLSEQLEEILTEITAAVPPLLLVLAEQLEANMLVEITVLFILYSLSLRKIDLLNSL